MSCTHRLYSSRIGFLSMIACGAVIQMAASTLVCRTFEPLATHFIISQIGNKERKVFHMWGTCLGEEKYKNFFNYKVDKTHAIWLGKNITATKEAVNNCKKNLNVGSNVNLDVELQVISFMEYDLVMNEALRNPLYVMPARIRHGQYSQVKDLCWEKKIVAVRKIFLKLGNKIKGKNSPELIIHSKELD